MLEADKFLVKEQVKFLQQHQTYDIFDADTQRQIGVAEETIGSVKKILRWFISKSYMSTTIEVRKVPDNALVFTIRRGAYIFRSKVEIHTAEGEMIGYFKSKLISWGGGFWVYDKHDKQFAEVKGNLIGFNYRVLTPDGKVELGNVGKKWGGALKELFTAADTYMIDMHDDLKADPVSKMLVLGACLAIDMIYKSESKSSGGVSLGE